MFKIVRKTTYILHMKIILSLLIVIISIYLIIMILVWMAQKQLIFFPQPLAFEVPLIKNQEEVYITTAEGNILHGWLRKAQIPYRQKLIIYFGGNAEEVSHILTTAPQFNDWAYLLINYPGYGKSEGSPGKKSFYDAALAIYDYAVAREDIDATNLVVMGRSIGTGTAVYLAAHRKVSAVILISPFESLRAVAQNSMWFLPVGLLLRHNFDSKKHAKQISAPLLAFYGTQDTTIPPQHTIRLTEYWKGKHVLVPLQGYSHNDIFNSEQLWVEVATFLVEIDSLELEAR